MTDARRSRWIPWAFVCMFGIIIAVNLTMALFAFSSWTGLTENDPYRRGLVHNSVRETVARQERLGWEVALGHTPLGARRARLRLVLRNDRQQPVHWAKIRVMLVRPVAEGSDFLATMRNLGNGEYQAVVVFPRRGLWEARYRIDAGQQRLHAVRRLEVR